MTLDEFCRRRKLDPQILASIWGVEEITHKGRPAIRFPTSVGIGRVKYLDGGKPKNGWVQGGGSVHAYGMGRARDVIADDGVVYLVNGEISVWACFQSSVPAVCFAAGEGTMPKAEVISDLIAAGVRVVRVVYDLDQAGRDGAIKVAGALREGGLEAVALELPSDLGDGGDVDDLHRRVGDRGLAGALAELPGLRPVIDPSDDWPDLGDLPPATPEVPNLPPDLLPAALRDYVADVAQRASLPVEMVAVPVLVVTSAVIGRGCAIKPERFDDWTVVPNLWGAVVAPPGSLKTHAVGAGTRLLHPLIEGARREYEEQLAEAEIERARIENELALLTKGKGAGKGDPVRIADLRRELKELEVVERRYTTSDATVEKLGELLKHNGRGMLLERDEIAGWARALDKPGREGDREFYLEAWNGDGSFQSDRIGRGSIYIPALCLAVLGGIQPGKLSSYVAEATGSGAGADGLLQRFQALVWPDGLGAFQHPSGWDSGDARRRAIGVMERLASMNPRELIGAEVGEFDRVPIARWSPPAQELFDVWRVQLEHRLRSGDLAGYPAFASYVGKQRSFMPSLALICDLVDRVAGVDRDAGVSLESAQRAAALVEYFEAHARKVYAVELQPGRAAACALAARIKAREIRHQDTVRDVGQHDWKALGNQAQVRAGLAVLEGIGWCRVVQRETGGRPSEVVELHPSLRGDA